MNNELIHAEEDLIIDCGEVSVLTQGGFGPKFEPSVIPERPLTI